MITSYQLGLESNAFGLKVIKATIFTHLLEDLWAWDWTDEVTRNHGDGKRYGYKLELNSMAWNNLSARASFTSVYLDYDDDALENDNQYTTKLTILYDNPAIVTAELFGSYTWWAEEFTGAEAEYDTIIWDLNLNKEIWTDRGAETAITLFASAHNLFNGRSYWHPIYENPQRWVEAGLRLNF